jgi:hypothetical protein
MDRSKSRKSNRKSNRKSKHKRSRSDSRTSSSSSSRKARPEKVADSNWDKVLLGIGIAVGGRQGSKAVDRIVDYWESYFNTPAATASAEAGSFVNKYNLWKKLADTIMTDGSTKNVSEVISAIPGALGTKIQSLCPANICDKTMVTEQTLGYLAIVGIPLSVYLFVKFRGTDHEKQVLERKLREAKRISDERTDSSFYDYSSRKK